MDKKVIFVLIYVSVAVYAGNMLYGDDFTIAEQAFAQGHYAIAEAFFKTVIKSPAFTHHVPDAVYYLTRIYKNRNDGIQYVDAVHQFLRNFEYDLRSRDLACEVIEYFIDQKAYRTAYQYSQQYSHLFDDSDLLFRIGVGLYQQDARTLAGQVLSRCDIQDTVLILLASLSDDWTEKHRLYEGVKGIKGTLYAIEAYLQQGDTLKAYEFYHTIDQDIEDEALLFRYAKVSYLFDRVAMQSSLHHLQGLPAYAHKALYMQALASGNKEVCALVPNDCEECGLYALCVQSTLYEHALPESITIDSILPDSFGLKQIEDIRTVYPGIFTLDSLYCELLIRENMVQDAFAAIEPYRDYVNTCLFVRFIRGIRNFRNHDYAGAVKDILLSQNKGIRAQYALAKAMGLCGLDPLEYYRAVLDSPLDSVFRMQVQKEILPILYQQQEYQDIIRFSYDIVVGDDSLQAIYLYSLAHTGKNKKADSLACAYYGKIDPVQTYHYGLYLIENKAYRTARFLYDSLYNSVDEPLSPPIQYSWALVPMLQGDNDSALYRFKRIIERVQPGPVYFRTMFKCASIHYIKEEYDSAAYYYGRAKTYDSLQIDALQNQLICYKKAAEWKGVMQVAEELLPLINMESAAEIYFEYGYAQLRYGDLREAIENFQHALQHNTSPEYLFWIAETYLAKGAFVKALYHYRRIMGLFPKEEMWMPTAWYKVGITLEFMDELDEAKLVYQDIIKKRGGGDTWSIEAKKRLEMFE